MSSRGVCAALAVLLTLAFAGPAVAADSGLNAYKVKAGAKQLLELKRQGYDITEGYLRGGGIEVVATKGQAAKLRKAGVRAKLLRDRRGRTARKAAAAQAAAGWQVWRPFARTDVEVSGDAGNPRANLKTQLERLARRYDRITELVTIGRSINGLPIYAMRVTANADRTPDGRRPAVLYTSVQHAREWLAGETNRRQLRLFLDNYGETGTAVGTDGQPVEGVRAREVTRLVNTRELWFVLIANPDGYDHTFTPENRLWRKNLHDNNGDGEITAIDGVDLNRNFPTRWNYDNEGSSTEQSSETFRGTGPASEPETVAIDKLIDRVRFTSNKNDHTHGSLLLWPPGWQVDTHFADEPIFEALAGDDANPAIPTFDPDVGADLYTTNGDTNDHLYQKDRVQSFTPEGKSATGGDGGFIFQDVEADVQEEFERHVQFALDLARSADDPDNPVSHLGNEAPDFQLDRFSVSFGSPQTVSVNTRRDLGRITMKYRVNGGRERSRSTEEWDGGERYGDEGDYWYHRMRGVVRGADEGDEVEVWFEAREATSRSFTYTVRSDTGNNVLVLAQEDYTGNSAFPAYPSADGPFYLDYYTDALDANGVDYDVYDLDAEGRNAPHALGVLSHYDAVIWYTGNDNVTRASAQPGVAGEEAHDTTMAVRDFVNEGGTVALSGVHAGRQYDLVEYPQDGLPLSTCDGSLFTTDGGVCAPLSNDFLQYYLGSYIRADGGGLNPEGGVFDVVGIAEPFLTPPATYSLNDPAQSAGNQEGGGIGTGTHLVTSSILPADEYPQFASEEAADWATTGAPFDPHTGAWYMTSQNIDQGYKRLTRTIDLRGKSSGELSFWTSYNVEPDWDYVFVEAQSLNDDGSGVGDFTMLPDANGHSNAPIESGASCAAGWSDQLHNRLNDYVTYDPNGNGGAGSCTAKPGKWHAATGNSGGWQEWKIDLSGYANKQVEISIVYATDWGTLTVPGMLVDDTKVTVDGAVTAETSFETPDLGGWTVPGAHEIGPSENLNDWIRSEVIFEDAAVTKTAEGLVFGFGFEGVNTPEARADVMGRTVDYLLGQAE